MEGYIQYRIFKKSGFRQNQYLNTKIIQLKNFKIYFWLTFLTIAVISILPVSFINIIKIFPKFYIRLDYIFHFISYLILASFFTAWRVGNEKNTISIILIIAFGIIFSLITEVSQIFIPIRSFNHIDIISNIGGYFLGSITTYYILNKTRYFINEPSEQI